MIIRVFIIFSLLTASAVSFSGENEGIERYNSINTIYGFKLSKSKLFEIYEYFGLTVPTLHGEKHDLAEVCIKNVGGTLGVTFITGVIHDYETLYGYRLTNNPKEDCYVAQKQTLESSGVIVLGVNGEKVITELGSPNDISSEEVNWKLDIKIPWDEPIINSWEAGPEENKYTQVRTVSGEYHLVSIRARFTGDSLSEFEVMDYAEADFKIENVYQKKI